MFTEVLQAPQAAVTAAGGNAGDSTMWIVIGIVLLLVVAGGILKNPWGIVGMILFLVLGLAVLGGYELLSLIQHVSGAVGATRG